LFEGKRSLVVVIAWQALTPEVRAIEPPFVEVYSPFLGMNTFHVEIDKSTPQDTGNPQPGGDIKTYTLQQIPNLHVKD
jgi:hypothetical protein